MTEQNIIIDHAFLDLCRPLMILGAFFTQKPSVMSEPGWKLFMQPLKPKINPSALTPFIAASDVSFLITSLAELPTLLSRCNECIPIAKAGPSSSTHSHLMIVWTEARQLQRQLRVWKQGWDTIHQSEIHERVPTLTVKLTDNMPWSTILFFESIAAAITFILYHSVNILLTSIPLSILQAGLQEPDSILSGSYCDADSDYHSLLTGIETSVHSICRSINYCLENLQSSEAPPDYYLFFPIYIARWASIRLDYTSELAWLADANDKMRSRLPMGIWALMDFDSHLDEFQEGILR